MKSIRRVKIILILGIFIVEIDFNILGVVTFPVVFVEADDEIWEGDDLVWFPTSILKKVPPPFESWINGDEGLFVRFVVKFLWLGGDIDIADRGLGAWCMTSIEIPIKQTNH